MIRRRRTAQDGMLSSWAAPTEAKATMEAMWKVFIVTDVKAGGFGRDSEGYGCNVYNDSGADDSAGSGP